MPQLYSPEENIMLATFRAFFRLTEFLHALLFFTVSAFSPPAKYFSDPL